MHQVPQRGQSYYPFRPDFVLGCPWLSTALSIAITWVAAIVVKLITETTPFVEAFKALPWWIVPGGLIGLLVVGCGAAIVPVTGPALFFVCLIAGQLLWSVLLDQIGAFGPQIRDISAMRLLGVLLTFAGVPLVRFSSWKFSLRARPPLCRAKTRELVEF